jgi:uncharacterized membrane protein SirB2
MPTTDNHRIRLMPLALCAAALAYLPSPALDALRASGLTGKAPRGAGAFKALVSTLTDNATWLIATGIGLLLVAAFGALIFSVRSAPEWLFKAMAGIIGLLVGVPAILA